MYKMYIGLKDKDTKKQKIPTFLAARQIEKTVCNYIGGATIYRARGCYKHENGQVVRENTVIVETSCDNEQVVLECVKTLKVKFNQESIGFMNTAVDTDIQYK